MGGPSSKGLCSLEDGGKKAIDQLVNFAASNTVKITISGLRSLLNGEKGETSKKLIVSIHTIHLITKK